MKYSSILVVSLTVSGCAAFPGPSSVQNGETQSAVRAKLGTPAAERKLGSGDAAWYYITGPSGFYTYRVVFGTGGAVADYSQVLTMRNFMTVPRGATKDTVLDELGPPMEEMSFQRTRTQAWTYRWIDGTFEMLADAVFDLDKGTLDQIVVHRDPAFTDSISP
jgi:hypothetical protein